MTNHQKRDSEGYQADEHASPDSLLRALERFSDSPEAQSEGASEAGRRKPEVEHPPAGRRRKRSKATRPAAARGPRLRGRGGASQPPKKKGRRGGPTAGSALLVLLVGLLIAVLFSAEIIERRVVGQPLGAGRTVSLVVLKPIVFVSHVLYLDRPARGIAKLIGRDGRHHSLADVKPIETAETKKKVVELRKITTAKPLRLYIMGDSMAGTFGACLKNMAEKDKLVRAKVEYKVSSGLCRPDFFSWPQRAVDILVERNPEAIVVLFGANDNQNLVEGKKVLVVGTEAWRKAYQGRVGEMMTILTRGERRVYWVGNPVMRKTGYSKTIAMMNSLYEAEAKNHPGVTYISTWELMSKSDGGFAEYLPNSKGRQVLMRYGDGIHVTQEGGNRMAKHVLSFIARDWHLPQP